MNETVISKGLLAEERFPMPVLRRREREREGNLEGERERGRVIGEERKGEGEGGRERERRVQRPQGCPGSESRGDGVAWALEARFCRREVDVSALVLSPHWDLLRLVESPVYAYGIFPEGSYLLPGVTDGEAPG